MLCAKKLGMFFGLGHTSEHGSEPDKPYKDRPKNEGTKEDVNLG